MPDDIAPTALVDPRAVLEAGVRIGHASVVHADVVLRAGTTVDEFCVVGAPAPTAEGPLDVGEGSRIRSHSVIYAGSRLGAGFETGHHVVVRPGVVAGPGLRLGSSSSLEGDLVIGDHVRIQGYVQVGKGSVVGSYAWLFSLVTLTNDPLPPSHLFRPVRVGEAAVLCVGVTALPGVVVGDGAFVAAGAVLREDVPPAALVTTDGRVAGPVTMLVDLESGTRHPHPRHFADAYPAEAQEALRGALARATASARDVPRAERA